MNVRIKNDDLEPRGSSSLKKWRKRLVAVREMSLKEFAGLLAIGDLEHVVQLPQPLPGHLPLTARAWLKRKAVR